MKNINEIVDELVEEILEHNPSLIAQVAAIAEQQWTEEWGERCPDYDPDCACCIAWRKFDNLWR